MIGPVVRNHVYPKTAENPMQDWKLCANRCPKIINQFSQFECKYVSYIVTAGHVVARSVLIYFLSTSPESAQPPEASTTQRSTEGNQCSSFSCYKSCAVRPDRTRRREHRKPDFCFPFTRLADVRLPARNDSLCLGSLQGLAWLCEWPLSPRGTPGVFLRAQACTHQRLVVTTWGVGTDLLSLKVSASSSVRVVGPHPFLVQT